MQSKATTVIAYLAELPPERRETLEALRAVILKNLKGGYEEIMQYGMIGYAVPHTLYPSGYHCDPKQPLPFAGLASQKNHMSFYCFGLYTDEERLKRFRDAWQRTGLKLDMGASCIRFKKLEDLPLDLIGRTIAELPVKKFVQQYEARFPAKSPGTKRGAKKNAAETTAATPTRTAKKSSTKKPVAKKTAGKKAPTKKASAMKATKKSSKKTSARQR